MSESHQSGKTASIFYALPGEGCDRAAVFVATKTTKVGLPPECPGLV
jgi:hypothetical protein